jgi:hypothetical protein
MRRADVAYPLMAGLVAFAVVAILLSTRYSHYRRQLMRGYRRSKPPWKPFWMN